jgi:hypothetical protein
MASDLVLDPAELRATARAAEALLPVLQPGPLAMSDLSALAARPGGGVVAAEHDRLLGGLSRAEAELVELVAGLRAVAVAAESAEHGFLRSLREAGR